MAPKTAQASTLGCLSKTFKVCFINDSTLTQFFPSTLCTQGIKLMSPGLVASVFKGHLGDPFHLYEKGHSQMDSEIYMERQPVLLKKST